MEAMGRGSVPVLDPEFLNEVVQKLDAWEHAAAVHAIEELVVSWLYYLDLEPADETGG